MISGGGKNFWQREKPSSGHHKIATVKNPSAGHR